MINFDDEAFLRLDAGLGTAEQRTEPYMQYGEGEAQAVTTASAKNASGIASYASEQAGVVQGGSGFPNPATDTNIISLDITKLLVQHPSSTFFVRLSGNSWEDIGVFDGDIAIVDKALDPKKKDIVVWWDIEEFRVSKYSHLPKEIAPWGVVTSIIHQYRVRDLGKTR